jgi:hypothetical protein
MKRGLLALCLVALAACGNDAPATPSATLSSAPTTEHTTTTLSVEQQVEAAYLKSWDVYSKAMRSLDTSHLAEVYVGKALELRTKEVSDLKAANTPARMDVEHRYSIDIVGPDQAVVRDNYVNHSVLLHANGSPAESDPNNVLKREYLMTRLSGSWKIADVIDSQS